MPIHVAEDPSADRLEIIVREDAGSVAEFVVMVVIIGVAASTRGREAGDRSWIWWPAGLGVAALAWSLYAMAAEERYTFDRRAGTYCIRRRTLLGARAIVSAPLVELHGARARWVGYDDAVRGVELARTAGAGLTLPVRTTSLSEWEQARITSAIETFVRRKAGSDLP